MSLPQQPPLPADENRAASLYAAFWTPVPILAAVLAARFYVRFNMRNLGLDDWLMLLAFVCFIITNILGSLFVEAGGARHMVYIQPVSQLIKILHLAFAAQPFGAVACAVAKTSVAGLTLRIAGPNTFWRRWILYVGIFILWALTIVDVTLKYAQCDPMRANWDITILPEDKKCWNPKISANVSITNSSFGAFMDFILALLPCTIVWNLKVEMKTKLGLMFFLSLGVFAGIAATLKSQQLHLLGNRTDFTWGVYDMYIWTEIELTFVIFCGCIPPIKPLFDWMRKGKPIAPSTKHSNISSSGSGAGSRASKIFKSWMSSPSLSHKSTGSESSFTKSQLSGIAEDENELWGKPKGGQIMVRSKIEVDTQSLRVPSEHSTEGRGATPVRAREEV